MISATLLFVVSILLFKSNYKRKLLIMNYKAVNINSKTFQDVVKRNLIATLMTDNFKLNKDDYLYIYTANKVDSFPILELKNQIALFIPDGSCNVCYDYVYDVLCYCRDSLNYKLKTVTNKRKRNEVQNILHDIGLKTEVLCLENDNIWEDLQIKHAPFFCLINEDLVCSHCFIPIPNYPKYSYTYIKTLSNRYHKNKKEEVYEEKN